MPGPAILGSSFILLDSPLKTSKMPGVVVLAHNSSTQAEEAGGSRPAWLCNMTQSHKKQNKTRNFQKVS
jgi:hypothetical protein